MMQFLWSIGMWSWVLTSAAVQPDNCQLKKDKDGVRVFTCPSDTSKFRSLRAEFMLENVSFAELEEFMLDADNYKNWQFHTMESKVLERRTRQIIYRVVIDAPWPVSNREIFVELTVIPQSETRMLLSMHSIPYTYPIDDDLVRVPFSQSQWNIEKANNGLKVTYHMNIDPGGYVPPMLINMAMAEGPYQSFRNIKQLMKSRKR